MGSPPDETGRSGRYVSQPTGYRAFIPRALIPGPELRIDSELLHALSRADQALGRLDASSTLLPNPDLFVGMYVRKEAVLSSQIEGTQASLMDILEYEAAQTRKKAPGDVSEVVNYVRAMNYGLARLPELPLSNRLLREIHKELLSGARGGEKTPGEFRRSQNWIGSHGAGLAHAAFVPPPPHEAAQAMADLEAFIHSDSPLPVLLKVGLIHSQFETIHPFLDGNGRMGRLLITFFLCQQGVLKRPLLYLSGYFKQNREEYYERLQAVRDGGDWESWLRFFLNAVWVVARDAADKARDILGLREAHRALIQDRLPGATKALELLDRLYVEPFMRVTTARDTLRLSYPSANSLLTSMKGLGILEEITGLKRNRVFAYQPYLDLLSKDQFAAASAAPDAQQ